MAKKKKKRRPQQRPRPQGPADTSAAAAAADERSPSKRAERKEEARRERERRIRQAKRRRRTRRLVRWGVAVAVIGGIAGVVWVSGADDRRLQAEAQAAAERLSCTPIEETPELPNEHTEPFAAGSGGVPAVGGNHTPGALPAEPKVYEQQPPEETAIHNLEHGYVIVYYAPEGQNALDEEMVTALEGIVEDETEVLMSPYGGLERPLYLTAWGALRGCEPPEDASTEDVTLVARAFIEEWKNGQYAPEAPAT